MSSRLVVAERTPTKIFFVLITSLGFDFLGMVVEGVVVDGSNGGGVGSVVVVMNVGERWWWW